MVCAALAIGCPPATGDEIEVKNDSVVDGSQAVLFGDFLAGEEAAVWLTSPCDGDIVAVRIFFLSINPGAQPVIHQNIWIYEAGAFPEPGDVLEQLESPALTPGFLNEFRFIDEQGTTELRVPILTGETFVVSLEFAEPTDIAAGTPSLVRDIDGCQNGRNAVLDLGVFNDWLNFCNFLGGDVFIRAVVDCGEPTGACCLPTGECASGLTSAACSNAGGSYQGNGVTCESVTCPQPEMACCLGPEACVDLTVAECAIAGGLPAGFGTDCDTHQCYVSGACCFPDGGCSEAVPAEVCTASGGAFHGGGVTCDEADCPQPEGACCFNSLVGTHCFDLEESACALVGHSNWAGPFTRCEDRNVNGVADICECPTIDMDWDGDCDVDGDDYAQFESCRTGGATMSGPLCQCFDTNGDQSIGVLDFADLQILYTDPGQGCP